MRIGILLTTAVVTGVAGSAAWPVMAGAAPSVPASLQGETLDGALVVTSTSCDAQGNSTIKFTATGASAGPYPGTFTASGTASIGPETLVETPNVGGGAFTAPAGPLVTYTEAFTIDSSAATGTTITGTKTIVQSASNYGWCDPAPFTPPSVGQVFGFDPQSESYSAIITGPSGSFQDTGTGGGVADDVTRTDSGLCGGPVVCGTGNGFLQFFTMSNGVVPLLPTSADQCKDGDWQVFGVFKNQGDCVSFVATRGTNPPG